MTESPFSLLDVSISPENIITKSNVLIDSSYRLSALETKLILTLFSNVQPTDQELNTYVFPILAFVDLLELKGKSKYNDLRVLTKGLMEKSFEIKMDDELHQVSWLSYVKYNDTKGTIMLRFDSFWKPFILQLQKNFTTYKLGNITKLKSAYSIRLYELLKQRQGLKTRTFYLRELRDKLGVPEEVYPKYSNFKQRVLLTAQRELLQESDISFDFTEIKHGRSVEKIKFEILNNGMLLPKELEVVPYISENVDLLRELLLMGIEKNEAETLVSLFPEKRILENIVYTNGRIKMGRVKMPAAYLKRSIEQDFANTKLTAQPARQEIVPDWMNNPVKTTAPPLPEAQEVKLLDAIELMKSLDYSDERIFHDISIMMLTYIQKSENHVHFNDFQDPLLQQICKEVMG